MNILITGVKGYIGFKIAFHELKKNVNKVIGLDFNSKSTVLPIDNPNFTFAKSDITNAETFSKEVKKTDVLIHCAALVHKKSSDLSRENYFRVNYEGTKNLLNFLDKDRLKQIVFLSTVSVYGDISNGVVPDEGTQTTPRDFYGESKLAAENTIKEFSEKYKIPYTIFRLAPVYGEGFLLNINKRIYLPKQLAFYRIGSGEQRLSLLSVENVVDVVLNCIMNEMFFYNTFNLTDYEYYSVNQVILFFKRKFSEQKKPVITIPEFVCLGIFRCLRFLMRQRVENLKYQFNKIAGDSIYSVNKLRSSGIKLKWNLYNTFANSSLSSLKHKCH